MRDTASRSLDTTRRDLILLWLLGACLRLTILAVPPVIVLIQSDLRLSATEVGLLNNVPVAMFALAALPGALLVARLGLRRTLVIGLSLISLGSACRGLMSDEVLLFMATVVMGAGVAILQPALPACVRLWTPNRVGFATAVYTNGLLASEVVPVLLTLPLLPLVGGWRPDLVFWSVPIALVATVVSRYAPQDAMAGSGAAVRWMPDWRNGLIWRLALLFVGINSVYFGTNAYLPILLKATGRSGAIGYALLALNFAQIPASLLLLWQAQRLEQRAWTYGVCSVAVVLGLAAIVFGSGPIAVIGAGLVGFSAGAGLILALTLPALLAFPQEVARTSAAVFTVSYGGAVVIGVLSGVLWDLTRIPQMSFVPLALAGSAIGIACLVLKRRRELR